MATLTISFTLSTADQTRVVAAYQVEANADLNGTASPAQVMAYIKKSFKNTIIAKVQGYEYGTDVAAIAPRTPPDLT